ncbi:MAG: hypothetical protein CTY16_15230 [Methylobacter sp.]|nr:MAG: hypothetical protein CTY16_15230 [Methylobacter sp.]
MGVVATAIFSPAKADAGIPKITLKNIMLDIKRLAIRVLKRLINKPHFTGITFARLAKMQGNHHLQGLFVQPVC